MAVPPSRAPERLRRGSDIARVRRSGRRAGGPLLAVFARPAEERTRVAMVSPRAVGGAVLRNRARRLLREAWRSVADQVEGEWDVVLVAAPGIRGARAGDVASEIESLLRSVGVRGR